MADTPAGSEAVVDAPDPPRRGRPRPAWAIVLLAVGALVGVIGTALVVRFAGASESESGLAPDVEAVVEPGSDPPDDLEGDMPSSDADREDGSDVDADSDAENDGEQRSVDPESSTTTVAIVDDSTDASPPSGSERFMATFDGNGGLDRFRFGVYHRDAGYHEAGRAPVLSGQNNSVVEGRWTGDHDQSCGSPDTQRPLRSDFRQDTTGENGWEPYVDFHADELVYLCRNHLMTSMGEIAAYSVVWFSPDQVFSSVSEVCFDVNLTDLGNRQWWKVGVVSDSLFNSTYRTGYNGVVSVPGFMISDVGSADLDDSLEGPDRIIATWSGGASAGYPGALKIGNNNVGGEVDAGSDKATRHPVCLTDNLNGTVTFTVAGESATSASSFPSGPSRVVFYDHNYTPDKDGTAIGHTWHWDNIIVT